jgi:signal transduction histidine kinase
MAWADQVLTWQSEALRSIARGESLAKTLDLLCRLGEQEAPGRYFSVLLVTPDGKHLTNGAAPSLPQAYLDAIEGIDVAEGVGSCGTAASTGETVIASDIQKDHRWTKFRALAKQHGLAACWSTPIRDSHEAVVGTWAVYTSTPIPPTPQDLQLIQLATNLAAVAIERSALEQQRHQQSKQQLAESELNARLSLLGERMAGEHNVERLTQLVTDEATQASEAAFGAFFFNAVSEQGESYMLYNISGAKRSDFAAFPVPRKTAVFGPTFKGEHTVRSGDITAEPQFGKNPPYNGLPAGHLPVRSYLAVPVKTRSGDVVGGLFLGHPEPNRFTEIHQRGVETIAGLAAVAMQNAKLLEALRTSEESARSAHEKAASANRRKDEFLAILGHELRNPLAPIVTTLDLMSSRGPTERDTEVIRRHVAHVTRLVDDLLDIAAVTRGSVKLRQEVVDMADIIGQAVEMTQPLLKARGHRIQAHADPQCLVKGDTARLCQVFGNLLSNAARYTPQGGSIEVACRREQDSVVIDVRDDGEGIPPELLAHVFEPFKRGQHDATTPGLGIGLAIVESLVSLHGGNVIAHSQGQGKGSTFTVTLPAATPTGTARPLVATAGGPKAKGRVLVVDDTPDIAELTAELVGELGYETRTATDGLAALAIAEKFHPDIVILDIGMPHMDGLELTRRLRQKHGDTMRLVALSGYGQEEDRMKSKEAGVDAHLVKPASVETLTETLAELRASMG